MKHTEFAKCALPPSSIWKCLLADRYGLPIGDYSQTVHKICMDTSALPQSFEQWGNSYSFVQSIGGLPTRRDGRLFKIFVYGLPTIFYWQTVTICQ